jgi:hypothetical protein
MKEDGRGKMEGRLKVKEQLVSRISLRLRTLGTSSGQAKEAYLAYEEQKRIRTKGKGERKKGKSVKSKKGVSPD